MGDTRPTQPLPSLALDDGDVEKTAMEGVAERASPRRAYLVRLSGGILGQAFPIETESTIGRSPTCSIHIDEQGISRVHVRLRTLANGVTVEDAGSVNGTYVNGTRITAPVLLQEGDRIRCGGAMNFRFALYDEADERMQEHVEAVISSTFLNEGPTKRDMLSPWTPDSWQTKPIAQAVEYDDPAKVAAVVAKLRRLPPLVTSWEIEDLKNLIAEAQDGRRFLLQGGDCAETLEDCERDIITNKLKILIQMSLVLIRGARRPVIRVGRFAGQYAKPRSRPFETRDGVELPSYFGDLVNRPEFTAEARRPDPELLLQGYMHAALTLNFIRALSGGGFADLRRPDYFDLSFERFALPTDLRNDYARICKEITDGLQMVHSFGDRAADDLMKVTFYTSHEGLNLLYEAAQTSKPPRRDSFYDLTTHMPWIGDRTRALDGAHVEFFRGIANPIAVKIGPSTSTEDVLALCRVLNPLNAPGKMVLVTRLGAQHVAERLPTLVAAVQRKKLRVLWVCDPMHGNAVTTRSGVKTRNFDDILSEVQTSIDTHQSYGSYLGGVHFELTGEDVTECVGGGLSEADLSRNYLTACDPRLNYRQAIEMAFSLARRLTETPRAPSNPPPSRAQR